MLGISSVCGSNGQGKYLKHSQEQMLFSAFVLIAVNGKHDGLQQRVNFRHCDQSTQVRNVSWFGLEEEQEVTVSLCLLVVGKEAFLKI